MRYQHVGRNVSVVLKSEWVLRLGGWQPGHEGGPPVSRLLSDIVWKQHFVMAGSVGVGEVTDLALLTSALGVTSVVPRDTPGSYRRGCATAVLWVGSEFILNKTITRLFEGATAPPPQGGRASSLSRLRDHTQTHHTR
jgi:hypothetical protein